MTLSKEEADALRRCIAILAPISPAHERRTMALNVETRISGKATGLLAFRFTHLATLFHPSDTKKAQELAQKMQAAADAGEIATIMPPHEKGAFVSDLAAWPDCPPIPEESPLRYWLSFMPTPTSEQSTATPAPVVAESAPAWKEEAQQRARETIARQKTKGLYPSQQDVADEIAREFRTAGVVGEGGKPLTGAYIKRHALNGISSAQNRALSTSIRRGK